MEKEKLNQAISEVFKSGDREAIAELIVEFVKPNEITTDFISLLLNTRTLKVGDALVKKLRKGLKVRTLVPGSVHLSSEVIVSDRVNYVLDGANVKVSYNEWELESGELGTVEDISAQMMRSLRHYYYNKIFTALSNVWSAVNTPDNFISLGSEVTATALEDAIDRINQTTPGVKAVVGTRKAMAPITKFGAFWASGTNVGYSPNIIDTIMKEGRIGEYYGAKLYVIDQVYDNLEDYNALIPSDKIVVIGENVGEFILYGDVKKKQYVDPKPTPSQWFLEIYQQFGLMVWNAGGIYVIGGLV